MSRLIDENTIIKMLNTMDRYTSEELTLCDTDMTFPKNEVFIVDDVFEGLDALPSAQSEPCEDAVSRVGAISHFRAIADATYPKEKYNEGFVDGLEFCIAHLSTMPSVTPKQRTGKWIKTARWRNVYKCDQCGNYLDFSGVNAGRGDANYCPNCGCRMDGGEQE